MRTTRNLLRKTVCYQQQQRWGLHEGFGPLISLAELKVLQSTLRHRPQAELMQAASELGITLSQAAFHAS
jgi:hypothetical protein